MLSFKVTVLKAHSQKEVLVQQNHLDLKLDHHLFKIRPLVLLLRA